MAVLWAFARAALQSITIDEATTYELWVAPAEPVYWDGASNNHILNSILMRLFTSLFGVSHLTIRGPALIGACLYILMVYLLCRLITPNRLLQWVIFVWLAGNPFVFDYLVAARGYGLASALLLGTLVVAAYYQRNEIEGQASSPLLCCVWCSILAALCIAANFSFAVAAIMAVVMTGLWTCKNLRPEITSGSPAKRYIPIWLACTLPGAAISFLITSHAVLHWPAGQLWWGATSLRETARTVIESSLYQPNSYVANPILLHLMQRIKPFLFPLLAAAAVIKLTLLAVERWRIRGQSSRWRAEFAWVVAGTLGSTVSLHWLAFKFFHVLLPQERTALYMVILSSVAVSLVAAEPLRTRAGRVGNGLLILMLLVVSTYFLSCLRLGSFKEWEWDADVQRAYSVVAKYNQRYGARTVASSWHYSAVLNFYRAMSGRESILEVVSETPFPTDRAIYVLHYAFDRKFLDEQGLKIVYRGESTELVVAIRPGMEGLPQ